MGLVKWCFGRRIRSKGKEMIQINQLKVLSTVEISDLTTYIAGAIHVKDEDIKSYLILKRSIDARKKPNIFYVYSVAVSLGGLEGRVLKKCKNNPNVSQ